MKSKVFVDLFSRWSIYRLISFESDLVYLQQILLNLLSDKSILQHKQRIIDMQQQLTS